MASKPNPVVSVIIPLYNHEPFVREAIESVLSQSFSDVELIVINDGSTDRSEAVVKEIKDDRITYLAQANQGAAKTINRGVHLARGEYVSILNSDDCYDRTRLEEALKVLEADRALQAVFSHIEVIDGEGTSIRLLRGAEENWSQRDPATSFKGANDIVLDLLAGNFLLTTSNLFCRRAVFDVVGKFANLRYTHDYDFFLRLCHRYNVRVIDAPLLKYRIHAANSLKQSEADVKFEIGLLLTTFLLNGGLDRVYQHESREDVALTKLFNSIATCDADKMMLVLVLAARRKPDRIDEFIRDLAASREDAFRRTCVEDIQNHIDRWQHSQETNQRLNDYRKSFPYRLWRALTWPRRTLFG